MARKEKRAKWKVVSGITEVNIYKTKALVWRYEKIAK